MSTNTEQEILTEKQGVAMVVTLNRPGALNALSHNMIQMISRGLSDWQDNNEIETVIFRGAGGKAFCAGGDIKATWAQRDNLAQNDRYFYDEYNLIRQIYHYPKPTVALMDGITMGGGYGVAGPCQFRVATENTKWAMPETGIGFFPDVASAYYLNKAPGAMGMCLALSGMTIGPEDSVYGGFSTHYTYAAALPDLMAALQNGLHPEVAIDDRHRDQVVVGPLCRHDDVIERCFTARSVEDIFVALKKETSEWAGETLALLETRSPLSLKVTFARMKRAAGQDFDTIIEDDYVIAQRYMRGAEFFEGVRAVLVDKDKNPKWSPDRLENVMEAAVFSHFEPTGQRLDTPFKG